MHADCYLYQSKTKTRSNRTLWGGLQLATAPDWNTIHVLSVSYASLVTVVNNKRRSHLSRDTWRDVLKHHTRAVKHSRLYKLKSFVEKAGDARYRPLSGNTGFGIIVYVSICKLHNFMSVTHDENEMLNYVRLKNHLDIKLKYTC